jgi:ATP-dependent Lhr-like helicase
VPVGGRRPRPAPVGEQIPGRWFRVAAEPASSTLRAHALAEALLDRHGVLTRGSVATEKVAGGFAAVYRVMAAMEETGRVQRGYFVEGLGAAQFAGSTAVDLIRAGPAADPSPGSAGHPLVLAATDPASPYGAALAWPASPEAHRPGRKAGATVVLDEHGLALFVERGGRSMLSWCEPGSARASAAAEALTHEVRAGRRPPLHVQRVDGDDIHVSAWRHPLQEAGLLLTPRGLRLRPDRNRVTQGSR